MKGPTMIPPLPPTRLPHQRGVALFVVIVFVMLSMLLGARLLSN